MCWLTVKLQDFYKKQLRGPITILPPFCLQRQEQFARNVTSLFTLLSVLAEGRLIFIKADAFI
jgi:hypothetical protein